MKISIKLLLVFVGVLGFVMLASDVVLWAYFKKGVNGDGNKITFRADNAVVRPLRPFKALVVRMGDNRDLFIERGEKFEVRYFGNDWNFSELDKSRVGDTLFLDAQVANSVRLIVPAIEYIRLDSNGIRLEIEHLKQPALMVAGKDRCDFRLVGVEMGQVTYGGGEGNGIRYTGGGAVDSLYLELGKQSEVMGYDVAVRSMVIVADSLKNLVLQDRTSTALQLVRKH
jgi:hypothetical protein